MASVVQYRNPERPVHPPSHAASCCHKVARLCGSCAYCASSELTPVTPPMNVKALNVVCHSAYGCEGSELTPVTPPMGVKALKLRLSLRLWV